MDVEEVEGLVQVIEGGVGWRERLKYGASRAMDSNFVKGEDGVRVAELVELKVQVFTRLSFKIIKIKG